MADSASAVLGTASPPSTDAIQRAAAFAREPFLLDGEDPAAALATGTPRRRALDAALSELEAGAEVPSIEWRREWSLLLGLDRVLSQDEPHLVDGTVLSAHQVDALSGTLTALLAEVERLEAGDARPSAVDEAAGPPPLASSAIPGEEDLPQGLDDDHDDEDEDEADEEPQDWSDDASPADADQLPEQPEDPNAGKRFWFEHATGAGKTVAALGFVESSQTGGVLILTHRRNLVDQFHGELKDRGYAKRITAPLLRGQDAANGPVTVETYQWFVRNAGNVSSAYTIVICDEAHTALGEKTSAAIRAWDGPIFIGMTATGALIARHVTDLFPTQTSRFDLAQAARRGVISPLRCVRIPPGPGVRTIAKVPLRRGEVDVEFDQELLAELLDQQPFNLAIADLYKTRFDSVPGVVYTAGVRHAHNVAQAFRDVGLKARSVSGETPKRELAQILAAYERGDVDVLVNAQLLAEGWNSPRATVCLHLAPTASKRIYQQRVGRVTRRHPGKEAGIVVDFVHPATKHDDPVVTLHSLLDRDVYRGGAIVVGPVRRGRGRRLRVERRVVPVTADPERRIEVFERELWRIAVEHLDWGEQVQWAALAGARVTLTGWRRARAMLHFDQGGELKRTFLVTAVQRNKNSQLRLRALQEIAAARDGDAFDAAIEVIAGWSREDKREGVKVVLQALAEKKIGRRDQANNWIWRCAEYTREVHEEYAVQRWPETKRLLGLLVNSAGGAHARNARRLVHAARDQDRRLQAALLAAAVPHTAEAGEVINGARARLARKPPSLARELLKNFPKPKSKKSRRRRRKAGEAAPEGVELTVAAEALEGAAAVEAAVAEEQVGAPAGEDAKPSRASRRRRGRRRRGSGNGAEAGAATETTAAETVAAEAVAVEAAARDADTGVGVPLRPVDARAEAPRDERPQAADAAAPRSADAADGAPGPLDAGDEATGKAPADDSTPATRPRSRRKAAARTTTRTRRKTATSAESADSVNAATAEPGDTPEAQPVVSPVPTAESVDPAAAVEGPGHRAPVGAGDDPAEKATAAEAESPAPTPKPRRRAAGTRTAKAKAAPEATPKAAPRARPKAAPKAVPEAVATATAEATAEDIPDAGGAEVAPRPRRRTTRTTEEPAAAKKSARAASADSVAAEVVVVAPRRPRTTSRKKAADLADSVQRASDAVRDAVHQAEGDERPTDEAA